MYLSGLLTLNKGEKGNRVTLLLGSFSIIQSAGADPGGGGPGARAPSLTLGFEAPKLSIFGAYLIFP